MAFSSIVGSGRNPTGFGLGPIGGASEIGGKQFE
jgi:hypothetical protein